MVPILGMIMNNVSLSSALFSKVQQRVLALLFGRPERSFYTSEIIQTARSGTGAVQRELTRLKDSGLVSVERVGNQKHYRANPSSPIFAELRSLVQKTVALDEPIKRSLAPFSGSIDAAFIYGSVAKGTDTASSDIDLMVIGDDLDYVGLHDALQGAEELLSRKINPTFLSPVDWKRKAAEKGSFVSRLLAQPMIFLHGSSEGLRRWARKNSTIS